MPKTLYNDLIAIVKRNSGVFVRYGKGDHEIWVTPAAKHPATIDRSIKSRFLANKILKELGINKKL